MLNDPPPENRPIEPEPDPLDAAQDSAPGMPPKSAPRRRHPLEQPPPAMQPQPRSQQPPRQEARLHIPTVKPYVTYVLVAVNVLIFIAGYLNPRWGNSLLIWGANSAEGVLVWGEYYRLFTAMFLHGGVAHILFNGYVLYMFGRQLEGILGHVRFGLIYVLGGLGGSLLSAVLGSGNSISVGASGAIFAIIGAEYIFLHQHRRLLGAGGEAQRRNLLFWGAINLAFGVLTSVSNGAVRIDNWGHLGGLAGGVALAWFVNPIFLLRRHPDYPDSNHFIAEDMNPLNKRYWVVSLYCAVLLAILISAVVITRRSVV